MADPTKAQNTAEPKSPILTQDTEVSRLKARVAELEAKCDAYEREAGLMRAALDQARDDGRIGGLPKDAVQLAVSLTVVQGGRLVDAKPGDVLLPNDSKLEAIKKQLPAGAKAFVVDKAAIAEARDNGFVRV